MTLYLLIGALFGLGCAWRWLPEDDSPEDYLSTAVVSCLHAAIWPLVLVVMMWRWAFEGKQ